MIVADECEKEVMTTAEVAELLGVTTRTVKTYREQRGLPFYELTEKNFRYLRSEVLAWFLKRKGTPDGSDEH